MFCRPCIFFELTQIFCDMTLQKHPLDSFSMVDFSPSMLLLEQYVPLLLLLLPPSNNGYPSDNLELSYPLRLGQISFITLV